MLSLFIQRIAFNYGSVVHKRKDDYKRKIVLALLVVPEKVTVIFSNMQIDERLNSLGHLRNPVFYHKFMLLFGFVTKEIH
jgi:hypothetical protein